MCVFQPFHTHCNETISGHSDDYVTCLLKKTAPHVYIYVFAQADTLIHIHFHAGRTRLIILTTDPNIPRERVGVAI